ncbi:MAG TPA: serine/threonine-protein kinase [Gemmatimonadaceae bacterium]|nr:serine/threonine-protein kinase [Gemmatimonadaceae bacterium]
MSTFEEQLKDSLSSAYDIERELGGGGMSRVFVATDRLLGRKVVIKVLSPELTAEVNRGRFRREIQVAAQLQHPHIVTLFAAGEHGDLVYYTMPFIEGESLKSALEKERRLPVPDVIRVLYDVVDALAYAHRHGVIHRDIKPGNILRSGNHALVTDFGVAKALNAAMPSATAMTSTGMAIGTPAYMAPEQLAGDPTADHRIDLYALGLLSYELLAGESPFAAPTPQGVLAAVLTREPTPLHEVRKDVPRKLSAIIMQCLSKIPGGRPPNAEALLDALDMIATSSGEIRTREHKVPSRMKTPVAAMPAVLPIADVLTPITPTPAFVEAPPPQAEKNRSRLFAGVAVLGLAVAAGGLLVSQPWKNGSAVSIQRPTLVNPQPAVTNTPAVETLPSAPAVIPVVDSMAIASAVEKRLALAEAAKKGKTAVNADSLRKAVQRELADSLARANAQRVAAAASTSPTTTAPAAPAPAPAAAPAAAAVTPPASDPAPSPSGKKRLAITAPRVSSVPALNDFTRSFMDALRVTLDATDGFDPIDADVVRDAQARTSSRDEAAKLLKPDVMVWPGYVGTGDTVTVIITVWDMRASSSFGIRVTSAKIAPGNADHYLAPLVQSTMKQLKDLENTPTFYRKK